jgi:hypothetical protein
LVPFTGVPLNDKPLQIVEVIGVIAGNGSIVTLTGVEVTGDCGSNPQSSVVMQTTYQVPAPKSAPVGV